MARTDLEIFFNDETHGGHRHYPSVLDVRSKFNDRWIVVIKEDGIDMFPERDISAIYITNATDEDE